MKTRWLLSSAFLLGCSGPSDGSGTVPSSSFGESSFTGSVAGRTLIIQDASGVNVLLNDGNLNVMALALENRAGLCSLLRGPYEWASIGLAMTFTRTALVGTKMDSTFPPGTYAIGATAKTSDSEVTLKASFYDTDKTCTNTIPAASQSATAGTVTIESVELGYATGRYDLSFGSERVNGKFKIPLCPVLPATVTAKRTCEPAT